MQLLTLLSTMGFGFDLTTYFCSRLLFKKSISGLKSDPQQDKLGCTEQKLHFSNTTLSKNFK